MSRNVSWPLSQCHLSQPLIIYQLQTFSALVWRNAQINNLALKTREMI